MVRVVDCLNGANAIKAHEEAARQVDLADRIVLTKTDIATGPERKATGDRMLAAVAALNSRAPRLDARDAAFDLGTLIQLPVFDPIAPSLDIRTWLLEVENYRHHHAQDVNRHSTSMRAFSLHFEEPVPARPFTEALEAMIRAFGHALLRVKGIVRMVEKPDTPVAFHGVQHVFHDPMILPEWPDDDRATRIVFISDGLAPGEIAAVFVDHGLTPDPA